MIILILVLKYKLKQTIPNVMIAQGKGRLYILYKYAETLVIIIYYMLGWSGMGPDGGAGWGTD